MATLREIAQQRGWNIDWDKLNSSGNDDGNAYRREIFNMVNQAYNPYGSRGAAAISFGEDQYNVPSMGESGYETRTNPWMRIGDSQASASEMAAIRERLGAQDDAALRGIFARGRGEQLYQGDRGMYNEYVADLGNLKYDPEFGWLPGEGGFQEGSRVGRSFRNMQTWGPAVVLAGGLLSNAMQTGSMLGNASGTGGGTFGGAEGGLKPAAAGGGGGGAGGSGLLGSGGEAATGAFDTAGWQGTGINGATGTRGMLGQMAYNAQGFLNNPVGWAMNNPVDAIRGASSLYNLGSSIAGRGNRPAPASGNSASKSQGQAQPINVPQTQFYTNPITQMQLAQLYRGR